MSNEKPSVFARLIVPTSNVFLFYWLVKSTQETLVCDHLGPMKRKYKCQGDRRNMGGHVHSQEHCPYKNYPSLISSRIKQEEKLVVSCRKHLK